jgi:hypothetical protein
MRPIDILIKTTEIMHSAIQAKDKDKSFEAVTILLMQIIDFFGFVEGTFEIMFPFLEQLKEKIEADNYKDAESDTVTLRTKFQAVQRSGDRKRQSAARLDS